MVETFEPGWGDLELHEGDAKGDEPLLGEGGGGGGGDGGEARPGRDGEG